MATDDRWNEEPDDRYRDGSPPDVSKAQGMVAVPALLLIIFGFLGMLVEFGFLGVVVAKPTMYADWLNGVVKGMPPGKERDQALNDLKKNEAKLRLDTPMNIGGTVLGILMNIAMIAGGLQMRSLNGYAVAMIGTVVSLIPIHGCCCFSIPIGIWAIIVLLHPVVKAAFAANSRSA